MYTMRKREEITLNSGTKWLRTEQWIHKSDNYHIELWYQADEDKYYASVEYLNPVDWYTFNDTNLENLLNRLDGMMQGC